MEIGPLSDNREPLSSSGKAPEGIDQEGKPADKQDSIEISNEARTKLAELADAALAAEPNKGTTWEHRVDHIRNRIEEGFYDRLSVREKIAENLMEDLDD
ncbi:MAG: flagellar biosynthesis anti-sigma factor FlgM [Candidatus Zixiibacteriota bacterium]|nr:MAG: flagellar biosynthesis anti-sigma factor FlgM [candidate division Zixibacteria bacterium]